MTVHPLNPTKPVGLVTSLFCNLTSQHSSQTYFTEFVSIKSIILGIILFQNHCYDS